MNYAISLLGDFWEFLAGLVNKPPGDGVMRAAAFVRYTGASGLGHVGWCFDFSDAAVNAGSVENPAGTPTAPATSMGYWDDFVANPIPTMAAKGYVSLKYINLKRANPVGAYRVAKWIGTQPYALIGRNCLDDAYDVLRAYGIPELAPPSDDLLPNAWFDLLAAALEAVQGFSWTRSAVQGFRERVGRAMATFAPLKVPTWRRPGHKDALNLQAQMDADKKSRQRTKVFSAAAKGPE